MIAASGLSVLVKPGTLKAYLHFEVGTFFVDIVLLVILIGLALGRRAIGRSRQPDFSLLASVRTSRPS